MKDTHNDPVTANKRRAAKTSQDSKSRKGFVWQALQWIAVTAAVAGVVFFLGFVFRHGTLPKMLQARRLPLRASTETAWLPTPLVPRVSQHDDKNSAEALEQASLPLAASGSIVLLGREGIAELTRQGFVGEKIFTAYSDKSFYFFHNEKGFAQQLSANVEVFENSYGRLESTGRLASSGQLESTGRLGATPQREVDPGAYLQWHHYSWPSLSVDRFPLTVDQNYPRTRLARPDEFRFWNGSSSHLQDEIYLRACPHHFPVTTNTSRLWQLNDVSSKGPSLVLQDSLPDFSHPDLQNLGQTLFVLPGMLPDDHGTHVAGLISAKQDDSGVTGAVPGLKILSAPLHVTEHSGERFITLKDVLLGLEKINQYYARPESLHGRVDSQPPPRVLLLNYGFNNSEKLASPTSPLRMAIEKILENDVAVVVPAGNKTIKSEDDVGTLPAAFESLLRMKRGVLVPVSGSDTCSQRAWFTRAVPLAGGHVLFAPAERIYSSIVGNDFGYLSGTSQAAAQVAGILARSSLEFPLMPMAVQTIALEKTSQGLRNGNAALDVVVDSWEFLQELRSNASTNRARR